MPKFPDPPSVDVLRAIEPDLQLMAQGTILWRIYFRAGHGFHQSARHQTPQRVW